MRVSRISGDFLFCENNMDMIVFLSNESALCKKSVIFITLKNNGGSGLYLTKKITYIN